MKTLAIYSNKGGVGKTAAAVNLAYIAAVNGIKTLICDLDPQGSTTYYFRVKPKIKTGVVGFLKGGKKVYKSIKGTDYDNLDLLPADFSLRKLDVSIDRYKDSTYHLGGILKPFKGEYDLIVLDCPASISALAENILKTADCTLVPLIPTVLSVRTHKRLLSFCRKSKFDLDRIHSFFSMVDGRKKMHHTLMKTMMREFEGVLPIAIPYLSLIEKMGIYREPVGAFAPQSLAAGAYNKLWDKMMPILFPTL
jgi:cellulose biosynthesis protein BcsQ